MDFKALSDKCGGCIFGDDLRLDLVHLEQVIQQHERALQGASLPIHHAIVALLKVIFNVARGAYKQALMDLHIIDTHLDKLPQRWRIRRDAYGLFIVGQQRFPPHLRFRPDCFEASGNMADVEYHVGAGKVKLDSLKKEVRHSSAPAKSEFDILEIDCLSIMTFESAEHIALQPYLHHSYPDNIPKKQAYQTIARLMAETDTIPSNILSKLDMTRITMTSQHFRRLNIEALLIRGSDEAANTLRPLTSEYKATGSNLDMAFAYMMQADHLLSPAATHPLALNLVTEGVLTGYEIDFWDQSDFETSHRLHLRKDADDLYTAAVALFRQERCRRGQGAISLRKACILHMQSLYDARSGDGIAAKAKCNSAEQELSSARKFLQLDLAYQELISAHETLLNITQGHIVNVVETAKAIGQGCKKNGNIQMSRFVGTLMLRFGRRQWLDKGAPGGFLLCCQCAQACAEAAEDKIYEYQATIAIAKLLCELDSIPAAHDALRVAQNKLMEIEAGLGLLTARLPATTISTENVRSNLEANMANLRGYFEKIRNSIRLKASNPSTNGNNPPRLPQNMPPGYREAAEQSWLTMQELGNEYSKAVVEALAALAVSDFDGYISRFKAFLNHLTDSFNTSERSVAGFHVMTLCRIDQYEEARRILPTALSTELGGTGKDEIFDSITSAQVLTSYGNFTLSLAPMHTQKITEHSLAMCVWAKDWSQAGFVLSQVLHLRPKYIERLRDEAQLGNWQAQAEIGAIYEHNDGNDSAIEWYLLAVRTLERSRTQTVDVEGRLANMSTLNSSELFGGLVRTSLRLYRMDTSTCPPSAPAKHGLLAGDWKTQALSFAEQGRARLLLDMLTLSNKPGEREAFIKWSRSSKIYRQYEDLLYNRRPIRDVKGQNTGPSSTGTGERGIEERTKTEISMLKAEMSKDSSTGIENRWSDVYKLLFKTDFQENLSAKFATIRSDTLVLHCNTYGDGTIVFALSNNGISRVEELALTGSTLRRRVLAYQKMMEDSSPEIGSSDLGLAKDISALLAEHLIRPFEDLIGTKSNIIFVPSQELFVFPLCTLPYRGRTIGLQKCCSTVPSLTILQQLLEKASPRTRPNAAIPVLMRDKESAAVGFSGAVTAAAYGTTIQDLAGLNKNAFQRIYESADIVYLTSHGIDEAASGLSPWQANVLLKPPSEAITHEGGAYLPLRVIDLADYQTQAAAVVFGACVTARGHTTLGNDMIGFSHAILQSGAQSFVGGLWSVSDWATMMLMIIFHSNLARNGRTVSIAQCLQDAQSRFCNLSRDEAISLLEDAMATYDRTADRIIPADSRDWFEDCKYDVLDMIDNLGNPRRSFDFQDPFFWAGWVVVGNGDARLLS